MLILLCCWDGFISIFRKGWRIPSPLGFSCILLCLSRIHVFLALVAVLQLFFLIVYFTILVYLVATFVSVYIDVNSFLDGFLLFSLLTNHLPFNHHLTSINDPRLNIFYQHLNDWSYFSMPRRNFRLEANALS